MKKEEWNKTAKDYYKDTLSPIKNSKRSPLFSDLKKLKSKNKTIIDLGCGLGELESILSKYFKTVTALDFSDEMILRAQQKNKKLSNVSFKQHNINDLTPFYNKFDIALSINSILTPNLNEIDKILKEIHKALKRKGIFIAILPAMEPYLYQAQLLKQKSESDLFKSFTNEKEYNFSLGLTNFNGEQKSFYRFEISWRFEKAGFKNIQIKKVIYSWKEFEKAGQVAFSKEKLLPWDWYITCEK
jgi:ubiquinone/menaquinone biosynthesis C-methylase UbiE